MAVDPFGETITVPTPEVIEAYKGARLRTTRRIQIFEADAVTPWLNDNLQERLISGDITVDSQRAERRSINCILSNKDGYLRHDPDNGLWYDKVIKAYRGLLFTVNGQLKKFEIQVGEFLIDTLSSERFPGHITISGRDYTKKLIKDQFAVDTTFSSGLKLDALVQTIATNGGITKFRLGVPEIVVGTQVHFERGSSRWDAVKKLCEDLNVEIYFDHEGFLVTRVYDDVSTTPPYFKLSYEDGEQNIIDFSKSSSDSNIYNHIVVTGTSEEETVTGYRFISVRENTNPTSPTRISRIGRRTFTYEVSYITSQAEADSLSLRLMNVKALEDYTLSFTTICVPWVEANRILEFVDPDEDDSIPTRFLYTTFQIPLGLGATAGEGKRITIVGQANADVDEIALEEGGMA